MTLKAFCTARWTTTCLPLGDPLISSTTHRPSTGFQLSIPCCSKSKRSMGASSGRTLLEHNVSNRKTLRCFASSENLDDLSTCYVNDRGIVRGGVANDGKFSIRREIHPVRILADGNFPDHRVRCDINDRNAV